MATNATTMAITVAPGDSAASALDPSFEPFFYEDGNVTCFWECWNASELMEKYREPGVMDPDLQYLVGLVLAISSSVFIGASFIVKKKSLIRLSAKASKAGRGGVGLEGEETDSRKRVLRASDGGMGYLSDWVWWTGLICMAVGKNEGCS